MIVYQKLTEKEWDTFIKMRIMQWKEKEANEDIDLYPVLLGIWGMELLYHI